MLRERKKLQRVQKPKPKLKFDYNDPKIIHYLTSTLFYLISDDSNNKITITDLIFSKNIINFKI